MFENFSLRELLCSLCCPVITFLWGAVRLVNDILILGMGFTGMDTFHLTYFPAVLIGGILPAFLTIALHVHTERYLIKRLAVVVAVYVCNGFIGLIGYPVVMFVLYMLVGIGAVFFQLFKVQDEDTDNAETAVIMLSDPVVYWTIYWLIFWVPYFLGVK